MPLAIATYNVMVYEPESVGPELRIGQGVLDALQAKANARLVGAVLPELSSLGLVPADAPAEDLAARSGEVPEDVAAKIEVPEGERFVVNTRPYAQMGGVPKTLDAFGEIYRALAPAGIEVAFFNTAGGADDYEKLAGSLADYPAMAESTWVVTTSLRAPMPKSFMARVEERGGGRSGSAAERRLAVLEGRACFVPIGGSIVMVAQGQATQVIYERLKHLRRMHGAGV